MPERNLVTRRLRKFFVLALAASTVVSMQFGCSKLRNGIANPDLLANRESVSDYILDPNQDFNRNQTPSDLATPNFANQSPKPVSQTERFASDSILQQMPAFKEEASMMAEAVEEPLQMPAELKFPSQRPIELVQSRTQSQDRAKLVGIENGQTNPANPMRKAGSEFALAPAPSLRDVAGLALAPAPSLSSAGTWIPGLPIEEPAIDQSSNAKPPAPSFRLAGKPPAPSFKLTPKAPAPSIESNAVRIASSYDSVPAPIQLTSTDNDIGIASPLESSNFEPQPNTLQPNRLVPNDNEFLIGTDEVEKPAVSTLVPPSALVSQPLSPILFDAQTRAVQVDNLEKANSLRRNEKWSHEKPVEIIDRAPAQSMAVWNQAEIESGPVRLNPESDLKIEADRIAKTNFSKVNFEACPSCRSMECDGTCHRRTRRSELDQPKPMLAADPVVIVATTSPNTIPPFADPPENDIDQNPIVEENSYEDIDDDEWLAMFGSIPNQEEMAKPCPECKSDACAKGCEEQFGGNFEPRQVELPQLELPQVELPQVDVANQFVPADNGFVPQTNQVENQSAVVAPWSEPFKPSYPEVDSNEFQADSAMPQPDVAPEPEPQTDIERLVVPNLELPNIQIPNLEIPQDLTPNQMPEFNPSDSIPPLEMTLVPEKPEPVSNLVAPVGYNAPTAITYLPAPTIPLAVVGVQPTPVNAEPAATAQPFELPKLEFTHAQPEEEKTQPEVRVEIVDNTVPWTVKLEETIKTVRDQLSNETDLNTRNGLEVNLRLLEVLERQMQGIEKREKQNMLTDVEKQYWQHQLNAVTLMLDASQREQGPARNIAAIDTLGHLRKAVERLESLANLVVSNPAFCTEISGFGQFKAFPSSNFKPRQRMLIYCEVENYMSNETIVDRSTKVHTKLHGSLAIYDQSGQAVQQSEYPIVDDVARKRRRDFYMYFPLQLNDLPAGQYNLVLTVEDLNGNKSASTEPAMAFTVR